MEDTYRGNCNYDVKNMQKNKYKYQANEAYNDMLFSFSKCTFSRIHKMTLFLALHEMRL